MLLTKQISEIKEIHLENNTTKCTYIVHYNYYNIVYDYSNTALPTQGGINNDNSSLVVVYLSTFVLKILDSKHVLLSEGRNLD